MRRQVSFLMIAALVASAAMASVAAAGGSGLAGWWKLDDASGNVAVDSSGNGNDGTLQGNGTWVEGVLDGAWQGDGDGDYIRVPHSESLNLSNAVTVSMWSYGGIAPDQLICKGNDGSAWVSSYSIRVDDDGSHSRQLNWRGRVGSSPDALNSKTALPTAEWAHIAITFDVAAEGNNQKIYFNGVLDAESRSTTPLSTNTADLLLGADGYDATRWHWQGKLDDVRVYSVALSASQVATVMTGGGFNTASSPTPADQSTDIPRDARLAWLAGPTAATHDVYLGTSFEDVNNAGRANPLGVLVSQDQAGLDYVPAGLEYGQTYYWRIDEVNGAPDYTVFQGGVWSFTVEPYGYPITSVTATASSEAAAAVAQSTVDGSGLNADDEHSTDLKQMWMTSGGLPSWIQYEFDKVYKLQEMWVWNSNQIIEAFLGFGAKDVT
ncbi:MAG: LamG domain-containing protein, partial [Solirubrobacterales bacterium]